MSMATKLGSHKITNPFDHLVSQDHVTNKNHYSSTTTMSMATKLSRMDGDLPWGALTHKGTWTFDHMVTWQTKAIIS